MSSMFISITLAGLSIVAHKVGIKYYILTSSHAQFDLLLIDKV